MSVVEINPSDLLGYLNNLKAITVNPENCEFQDTRRRPYGSRTHITRFHRR